MTTLLQLHYWNLKMLYFFTTSYNKYWIYKVCRLLYYCYIGFFTSSWSALHSSFIFQAIVVFWRKMILYFCLYEGSTDSLTTSPAGAALQLQWLYSFVIDLNEMLSTPSSTKASSGSHCIRVGKNVLRERVRENVFQAASLHSGKHLLCKVSWAGDHKHIWFM